MERHEMILAGKRLGAALGFIAVAVVLLWTISAY
jgi:hypothetical protein